VSQASGQEKTEAPTPQKKRKARREGQVARTQDLGAWAAILAATLVVPSTVEAMLEHGAQLLAAAAEVVEQPEDARALALLKRSGIDAALLVAPVCAVLLVVGLAASAAQGGLHVASTQVKPKGERLNPLKGAKRLLGPQGWWQGAKALLKSAVLGMVLYLAVTDALPRLVGSGALPLAASVGGAADAAMSLLQVAATTGVAVAALDYLVVRRRVGKQLRMTRQEVKDESKQTEGDPYLKAAVRSRQLAVSRNRMMTEVATADVVLVNPTHVAVALRYQPSGGAPRVVAKGAGAVATRIRERAEEHGVPLVRDVPLARALHRACELGQEIPAELYAAVARVLAFVMRLRATGQGHTSAHGAAGWR
jgi:flagellar biosynthetic protein FlhB